MRYLDAVSLAALRNLSLDLSRRSAEGHLSGAHRGPLYGFSQEFAQHRLYAPGDDVKRLDWKAYARRDRYFVKEFSEEKSLRAHVFLDASGSMAFGHGGRGPKWEHACRLALAMAYLVLAQGDAAGLVVFDEEARLSLPPSARFSHLEWMDRALSGLSPGGETDLSAVLRASAQAMERRGVLILVSDLLGDGEKVLETARALHGRRHPLFILQVLDPFERDLDAEGPVLFEALEGGRRLRCEADLVREAYRELFERRQRLYRASLEGMGARYGVFWTDQPWEKSLARYLAGSRP